MQESGRTLQLDGMALVINELKMRQNHPPVSMPTCKSFTWTVKELNRMTVQEEFDKNPVEELNKHSAEEPKKKRSSAVRGRLHSVHAVIAMVPCTFLHLKCLHR